MRETLLDVLVAWWWSQQAHDLTDPRIGTASVLRSPRVRAAAADLPQVPRCERCPAFVQEAGSLCHRCDPNQLSKVYRPAGAKMHASVEKALRELPRPVVATFRRKARP